MGLHRKPVRRLKSEPILKGALRAHFFSRDALSPSSLHSSPAARDGPGSRLCGGPAPGPIPLQPGPRPGGAAQPPHRWRHGQNGTWLDSNLHQFPDAGLAAGVQPRRGGFQLDLRGIDIRQVAAVQAVASGVRRLRRDDAVHGKAGRREPGLAGPAGMHTLGPGVVFDELQAAAGYRS